MSSENSFRSVLLAPTIFDSCGTTSGGTSTCAEYYGGPGTPYLVRNAVATPSERRPFHISAIAAPTVFARQCTNVWIQMFRFHHVTNVSGRTLTKIVT